MPARKFFLSGTKKNPIFRDASGRFASPSPSTRSRLLKKRVEGRKRRKKGKPRKKRKARLPRIPPIGSNPEQRPSHALPTGNVFNRPYRKFLEVLGSRPDNEKARIQALIKIKTADHDSFFTNRKFSTMPLTIGIMTIAKAKRLTNDDIERAVRASLPSVTQLKIIGVYALRGNAGTNSSTRSRIMKEIMRK